jgi:hypothetical protein
MGRVAGRRLENLRQQTIGVAREQAVETVRRPLQASEIPVGDSVEGSGELYDRPREGRQASFADDATDRALAADQGK